MSEIKKAKTNRTPSITKLIDSFILHHLHIFILFKRKKKCIPPEGGNCKG